MALTLEQIRQQYPQYSSISDEDLANALYNKYYAGKIDQQEFYNQIGLNVDKPNVVEGVAAGVVGGTAQAVAGTGEYLQDRAEDYATRPGAHLRFGRSNIAAGLMGQQGGERDETLASEVTTGEGFIESMRALGERKLEENELASPDNYAGRVLYEAGTALGQMLPSLYVGMATKNPNAALSVMGIPAFGRTYEESLAKGNSEERAAVDGWKSVLTELGPEKFFGVWDKALGAQGMKDLLGTMMREGGSEVTTETLDMIYESVRGENEGTLGDNVKRALHAGLIGVVLGGGIAAPSIPGNRKTAKELEVLGAMGEPRVVDPQTTAAHALSPDNAQLSRRSLQDVVPVKETGAQLGTFEQQAPLQGVQPEIMQEGDFSHTGIEPLPVAPPQPEDTRDADTSAWVRREWDAAHGATADLPPEAQAEWNAFNERMEEIRAQEQEMWERLPIERGIKGIASDQTIEEIQEAEGTAFDLDLWGATTSSEIPALQERAARIEEERTTEATEWAVLARPENVKYSKGGKLGGWEVTAFNPATGRVFAEYNSDGGFLSVTWRVGEDAATPHPVYSEATGETGWRQTFHKKADGSPNWAKFRKGANATAQNNWKVPREFKKQANEALLTGVQWGDPDVSIKDIKSASKKAFGAGGYAPFVGARTMAQVEREAVREAKRLHRADSAIPSWAKNEQRAAQEAREDIAARQGNVVQEVNESMESPVNWEGVPKLVEDTTATVKTVIEKAAKGRINRGTAVEERAYQVLPDGGIRIVRIRPTNDLKGYALEAIGVGGKDFAEPVRVGTLKKELRPSVIRAIEDMGTGTVAEKIDRRTRERVKEIDLEAEQKRQAAEARPAPGKASTTSRSKAGEKSGAPAISGEEMQQAMLRSMEARLGPKVEETEQEANERKAKRAVEFQHEMEVLSATTQHKGAKSKYRQALSDALIPFMQTDINAAFEVVLDHVSDTMPNWVQQAGPEVIQEWAVDSITTYLKEGGSTQSDAQIRAYAEELLADRVRKEGSLRGSTDTSELRMEDSARRSPLNLTAQGVQQHAVGMDLIDALLESGMPSAQINAIVKSFGRMVALEDPNFAAPTKKESVGKELADELTRLRAAYKTEEVEQGTLRPQVAAKRGKAVEKLVAKVKDYFGVDVARAREIVEQSGVLDAMLHPVKEEPTTPGPLPETRDAGQGPVYPTSRENAGLIEEQRGVEGRATGGLEPTFEEGQLEAQLENTRDYITQNVEQHFAAQEQKSRPLRQEIARLKQEQAKGNELSEEAVSRLKAMESNLKSQRQVIREQSEIMAEQRQAVQEEKAAREEERRALVDEMRRLEQAVFEDEQVQARRDSDAGREEAAITAQQEAEAGLEPTPIDELPKYHSIPMHIIEEIRGQRVREAKQAYPNTVSEQRLKVGASSPIGIAVLNDMAYNTPGGTVDINAGGVATEAEQLTGNILSDPTASKAMTEYIYTEAKTLASSPSWKESFGEEAKPTGKTTSAPLDEDEAAKAARTLDLEDPDPVKQTVFETATAAQGSGGLMRWLPTPVLKYLAQSRYAGLYDPLGIRLGDKATKKQLKSRRTVFDSFKDLKGEVQNSVNQARSHWVRARGEMKKAGWTRYDNNWERGVNAFLEGASAPNVERQYGITLTDTAQEHLNRLSAHIHKIGMVGVENGAWQRKTVRGAILGGRPYISHGTKQTKKTAIDLIESRLPELANLAKKTWNLPQTEADLDGMTRSQLIDLINDDTHGIWSRHLQTREADSATTAVNRLAFFKDGQSIDLGKGKDGRINKRELNKELSAIKGEEAWQKAHDAQLAKLKEAARLGMPDNNAYEEAVETLASAAIDYQQHSSRRGFGANRSIQEQRKLLKSHSEMIGDSMSLLVSGTKGDRRSRMKDYFSKNNEELKQMTLPQFFMKATRDLGLGRQELSRAVAHATLNEKLREAVNEITDTDTLISKTVEGISATVFSADYLSNILQIGTANGWASYKSRKPGWQPLAEKGTSLGDAVTFIPGTDVFAKGSDIYVAPEIADYVKMQFGIDAVDKEGAAYAMSKGIRTLSGWTKLMKVVLSPLAHPRNLVSTRLIHYKNNLFGVGNLRARKIGAKMSGGQAFASLNEAAEEFIEEVKSDDVRILEEWMTSRGMLFDGGRAGAMYDIRNEGVGVVQPDTYAKHKLKQWGKRGKYVAEEMFRLEDESVKATGFLMQAAEYLELTGSDQTLLDKGLAGETLTPQEEADLNRALDWAAETVLNTYPTFSRTSPLMKAISRNTIIGAFPSFPYEVARTSANSLIYSASLLNASVTGKMFDGTEVSNRTLAGTLGAAKLAGLAGMWTAGSATAQYIGSTILDMLDADDPDEGKSLAEKNYLTRIGESGYQQKTKHLKPWYAEDTLSTISDINPETGDYTMMALDYLMPTGSWEVGIMQGVQQLMDAQKTGDENVIAASAKAVALGLSNIFLNEEVLWGTFVDRLGRGQGRKSYKDDRFLNKMGDVVQDAVTVGNRGDAAYDLSSTAGAAAGTAAEQFLLPEIAAQAEQLVGWVQDAMEEPDDRVKADMVAGGLLHVAGLKQKELTFAEDWPRMMKGRLASLGMADRTMRDALAYSQAETYEQFQAEFNAFNNVRQEEFYKNFSSLQAAQQMLGRTTKEMGEVLHEEDVNKTSGGMSLARINSGTYIPPTAKAMHTYMKRVLDEQQDFVNAPDQPRAEQIMTWYVQALKEEGYNVFDY